MTSRVVIAVVLAATVTSCGVRPEAAPHELSDVTVPAEPGTTPLARPAAVSVYLVRDGRAVPVRRIVVGPATPARLLASLARGPDDREAAAGLATALPDLAEVSIRGDVAVVALPGSFAAASEPDRLLAVAQVVLTLTGSGEVRTVRFTVDGVAVAVPLPVGATTRDAVSRADYEALA